ncbi:MAG: hypothetical protein K6F90_01705 [Lachnospiraceae bacterium]|nr:hypothetical protein [Lachnospiraceae bacterium]
MTDRIDISEKTKFMTFKEIIKSNKGTSLVLVAALTVVIVALTVALRVTAGMIMASANSQLNQDQAYELAVSLGDTLEEKILNPDDSGEYKTGLELISGTELVNMTGFDGLPGASVTAMVSKDSEDRYVLTVTSNVGKASYIWTGIYKGSKNEGYKKIYF